ncbi:MAG TPA: hypothetical protein PLZ93_15550 [Nocardioides sp.]|uniref:hypothetical protein n=1 Tax=uncultured Nocardioides sp. TaxID=198441 RepID=UPI000EBDB6BD|nr:hypothetical protein [uncultured Nocardioides sp.]HCB05531.1 hypothetical protein [Nocardioides sp.]HRD60905.1 hypothetical protein [Nocardioides sp.]HRI97029.1 hypothetical protein [Nocardioides sp.]HRK45057.1 hypothetical protein [Nocardioides sp.]
MNTKKFGAIAMVTALPLVALGATVSAAEAAPAPQTKISANVSDKTPAAGKRFTVSGKFTAQGTAAANQVVKVQAEQANGTWKTLTGAKERTTAKGAYDIAVILNAKGQRDLRVVGVGTGNQPNAVRTFTVTVH